MHWYDFVVKLRIYNPTQKSMQLRHSGSAPIVKCQNRVRLNHFDQQVLKPMLLTITVDK